MQVTRETGLSNGMINNWIKASRQNEIKGLKAKKTRESNEFIDES